MKRLIWIMLLAALRAALSAAPDTASPPSNATMRYKMVAADPGVWIDPRRKADVRVLIDRLVANGFNTISLGTYKFMPMFFVDYSHTKYPEAQEYDPKKVALNVATLRGNIQLAKSKGIRWFISRSYSHYAPYRFWKAHQPELNPDGLFTPLLEKAHQNDIYFKTLAGKDNIIPQQQWTNPLFKDFFLYSTDKMLDVLPELDGFLNAYAEAAWTYDLPKLRINQWSNWKDVVDYKATDECFLDYTDRLHDLLVRHRGESAFFGMRDWYITPKTLQGLKMPKDRLVISVKYSGFDQPLVNYPPWATTLLNQGYGVILDLSEYDAEHPHPIYWFSRDILAQTFRHIYQGGFNGIMYEGYSGKGRENEDPIRLLTNQALGAAMNQREFSEQDAVNFLRPYYGPGTENLLTSLEQVTDAQAALVKLCPAWFWQGDGLTVGGPQTLKFWQLMDNPEAPPGMAFVRQDEKSIMDYVAAELSGPEQSRHTQEAWKAEGKKGPPEVMTLMLAAADQAEAAVQKARTEAPPGAPFMQDLVASAYIHREMVLRDVAFLRAAIAYYESGGQYDGKYNEVEALRATGMDQKRECMAQLEEIVRHDQLLRELCLHFAPRRPTTRQKHDYAFEKKIAQILGSDLVIPPPDAARFDTLSAAITGGRTPAPRDKESL